MDPVLFSFLLMSPTKKEIMDFRTAVEREVLYMAVQNADDEDIKNLRENLENFKSVSGDGQTLESLKLETDLTFHHLLGKATHNGFMERVYAFAMNYFSPYLLKTYESQDKVPELSVKCHEMLMEPIEKRDMSKMCIRDRATYDLAADPQYEDVMTAVSHLTGEKINRFTHIHQSTDDLIKKVKMQRLCGSKTASCFQRCVGLDAFNAVYSTTYEVDEKYGTSYFENFKKFLTYVQQNDLTVDGAMTCLLYTSRCV